MEQTGKSCNHIKIRGKIKFDTVGADLVRVSVYVSKAKPMTHKRGRPAKAKV